MSDDVGPELGEEEAYADGELEVGAGKELSEVGGLGGGNDKG